MFDAERIPEHYQIEPLVKSASNPDWTHTVDWSAGYYPPADRMNGAVPESIVSDVFADDCTSEEQDCDDRQTQPETHITVSDTAEQWSERDETIFYTPEPEEVPTPAEVVATEAEQEQDDAEDAFASL